MKVNYFKKFLVITLIFVMQFQCVYATAIIDGWSFGNPVQNGVTTTYDVTKEAAGRVFESTISISSSTTQIVKYLIKDGSSELAMAAMMQAVPNGKDFIIFNQNLNYTLKENNQNTPKYKYSSPFDYGDVYTLTQARNHLKRSLNEYPGEGNYFITVCIDLKEKYECYWGNKREESEPLRSVYFSRTSNDEYNSRVKSKTLSLKTIANKIINLANQENSAAKDYIAASNQDLVDNDEKKKKSLAAQLDAKLQKAQTKQPNDCPSGIRNKNGDCWICSKESHYPITRATRDAKTATRGKSCQQITDRAVKAANANLFRNLINARVNENSCWLPPDENHIKRLNEDRIALSYCEN
ncbi:hypothetical protein GCM10027155_07210 [Acinetobacter apis]|uniref:Uncharacterized protein n=1 Tax=Acinetobacter apis TaxID=1229165 RepID=A0A217EE84_9GAMM|nr:hypothetical protein [Acinetobacter apis]SNQ28803.1 hypothetical protein SAMN05444584_0730 [Acinetobacter apis]